MEFKQTKTEVEIKGSFGLDNNWKFTSASISSIINGEKITLKQTFENFTMDLYSYNVTLSGVKWTIIDGAGGTLEIDAGDISFNEYAYFDSWALEDIILDVDPSYDFTQTSVVSHTDSKIPVIDDGNNIIKITTNNISEFETNENGDLVIQGFGGNDKITTTSENDYIDGGVGADLTGNNQNNIIIAADGHDNLYGGLGNDTLTGGAGEDAFVFNTKLSSSNTDTITDFVSGEDWLSLNKKLFKKLAKSFTEDNLVYGEEAIESNDYLIFNSDNNTLYYDADGSGTKSSAVEIVVVGTMIDFDDIVVEY